jgi:hypothetical protein
MLNLRKLRSLIVLVGMSIVLTACAFMVDAVGTSSEDDQRDELPPSDPAEKSSQISELDDSTIGEVEPDGDNSNQDPFAGVRLSFNPRLWTDTDFTKHSIDYSEIFSGGPPPDGIPSIDNPVFESVEAADNWLMDEWPVMLFERNNDVRAYPLTILIFHEIVNDVVGGDPVALTFCPLCNATIAFNRTLPDGVVLDFGTSGNLRNSDLVMYDRQTKSWWQQFTGEAIVGELTGTQLEFLSSQIIAWRDFRTNHPDGQVLSRDTGFSRSYGNNPYAGYDSINGSPWFPVSAEDGRLPAMERVVAVNVAGIDTAYPFSALREVRVVNDEVADQPLVIWWKEGTDSVFGSSNDIGSTGVFLRQIDDQILTFRAVDGGFEDEQTGSLWNLLGEAIAGPMTGHKLERIIAGEHFWFAWVVFRPETIIWSPLG